MIFRSLMTSETIVHIRVIDCQKVQKVKVVQDNFQRNIKICEKNANNNIISYK